MPVEILLMHFDWGFGDRKRRTGARKGERFGSWAAAAARGVQLEPDLDWPEERSQQQWQWQQYQQRRDGRVRGRTIWQPPNTMARLTVGQRRRWESGSQPQSTASGAPTGQTSRATTRSTRVPGGLRWQNDVDVADVDVAGDRLDGRRHEGHAHRGGILTHGRCT